MIDFWQNPQIMDVWLPSIGGGLLGLWGGLAGTLKTFGKGQKFIEQSSLVIFVLGVIFNVWGIIAYLSGQASPFYYGPFLLGLACIYQKSGVLLAYKKAGPLTKGINIYLLTYGILALSAGAWAYHNGQTMTTWVRWFLLGGISLTMLLTFWIITKVTFHKTEYQKLRIKDL